MVLSKISGSLSTVFSNFNLSSLLGSSELLSVDLGSYAIKIVHLKKGKNGKYSLAHWGILYLPEEMVSTEAPPAEKKAVIVNLLKNYLSKQKIGVKNAITSVSGSSVIVRYVKFPKTTREELSKNIQFEAEPYIPFDIREVNIGYYIIGDITEEGQKKTETVLVAAKKDLIQNKLEIFQEVGLNLLIIDVDAFAIESCYEINRDPSANELAIMINIGANVTNMSIIENGISRVVRDIFIGGNSFNKSLQKNLSCNYKTAEEKKKKYGMLVTAEEKEKALTENDKESLQISNVLTTVANDLLGEIRRSIDFYYSQQGEQKVLNRVILCGGSANIKSLDKYFAQELKINTEVYNPLASIEKNMVIPPENLPMLGVATGLATRTLKDSL